jgi:hypothetical protein
MTQAVGRDVQVLDLVHLCGCALRFQALRDFGEALAACSAVAAARSGLRHICARALENGGSKPFDAAWKRRVRVR